MDTTSRHIIHLFQLCGTNFIKFEKDNTGLTYVNLDTELEVRCAITGGGSCPKYPRIFCYGLRDNYKIYLNPNMKTRSNTLGVLWLTASPITPNCKMVRVLQKI